MSSDPKAEYIDITPTWAGILQSLLLIYTDPGPTADDKRQVLRELERMAGLADRFVEVFAARQQMIENGDTTAFFERLYEACTDA